MSDLHTGFQKDSLPAAPDAMIRFLDAADQMPQIQRAKQLMREALALRPGDAVLDVGSGLGHELQRIAQAVGAHGLAVGVDSNPQLVAEAQRRAADAGLPVSCEEGDGQALPFADGSFDASRAERVLMYMPRPAQAVAEMARVVRSGGRVAVFDFDYGSMIIDAPEEALARQVQAALVASVPNGTLGRQLMRYFRDAGLQNVGVHPYPIQMPYAIYQRIVEPTLVAASERGAFPAAALHRWQAAVAAAEERGEFFALFLGMIVSGEKP